MRKARSRRRMRLFLAGAAILLIGLGSAVAIYLAVDEDADTGQGYEVSGRFIYPAMNERSKSYRHDLELYGGKAAVLADDFNRWFDSLWRGRTLAFTVAALSGLAASGFIVAARNVKPDEHGGTRQDHDGS